MNDFNSQENFPFDRLSGLIMDMQPKLLAGVRDSDSLSDSVFLFKEIMLSLGISFCLTEQVPSKLGETIPSLVSGTNEMCIVSKDSFSAFGSEDFVNWLNLRKSDHLILAGVESSICIYLTAVDAIRRGLSCTVLSDCVGCRRESDGVVALSQLRDLGCQVLPLETLSYAILGSARHTNFKKVSSLIRNRSSSNC